MHIFLFVCLFGFCLGGDSSFIFYCFYLTEKCCIFTVNIRFVLRSYGTLSERKEQWHHPAAEQAQWDTRYKHPCEWTLDQKHSLFLTLSVCWSNGTTNRLRIQLKTHVPMTHTAIGPSIWLCAKCQIFAIFSFFSCKRKPKLLKSCTVNLTKTAGSNITSTSRKQILF